MKPRREWPWVLAAAALVAFGAWLLLSRSASVRRFAFVDFYDYYLAARSILSGHDPYDAFAAATQARSLGLPYLSHSDFIYPAWFAVVMAPVALLPARAAAAAWFALSAAALLWTLRRLPLGTPSGAWWLAGLLFPPALFSLFVGQVNLVLLALLALAWRKRERLPTLAGVALGLAVATKLSPAVLALPLLKCRRHRMLAVAGLTLVLCAVVGEIAARGSTMQYLTVVLPGLSSLPARLAHPVNQGLAGFFLRLLAPNDWTRPIWNGPALVRPLTLATGALLTLAVTAVHWRAAPPDEARFWGALTAVLVVVSPVAWESTFALLLVPYSLAFRSGRPPAPLVASWVLVATQRGLDGFANDPSGHTWQRAVPPLSSLALYGALLTIWYLCRDGSASKPPHQPSSQASPDDPPPESLATP